MRYSKLARRLTALLMAVVALASLQTAAFAGGTMDIYAASAVDGASDWAKVELADALGAGIVPDSAAGAGWTDAASRLSAARAAVAAVEKASGQTMAQIAAARGWDLTKNAFADTDDPCVTFLKYAGVTNGVGGNRYDPDAGYTRAQAVTMLGRAAAAFFGETAEGANPFSDVPDWAAPYVGYAADRGITIGVGGGRFDSAGVLTNQETAIFAFRAYKAWMRQISYKVDWSAAGQIFVQNGNTGEQIFFTDPSERQEIVDYLQGYQYDTAVRSPYADVPSGGWSYRIVAEVSQAEWRSFLIGGNWIEVDGVIYTSNEAYFQRFIDLFH